MLKKLNITWEQTPKQQIAWNYLVDNTTFEVLFGGGAGGAKSFLGCAWLIIVCGKYPNTRWLMGRSKLKTLKQTTLRTFFDVCKMWGIENGRDFSYNSMDGIILFTNGSEILLKDLFLYPSDPNFDSLGSLEITGAFIDEANQITQTAKNIVLSRIRYKLDENKLTPKLLLTCNPAKNWVYSEFYKTSKDKTIDITKTFIQALATDNPFVSKHYIANLKRLDKNSKERLLFGNWEYDDDPSKLFDISAIIDLFTNNGIKQGKVKPIKYITVDVARGKSEGSDEMVIARWKDLQVYKIERFARKFNNAINIQELVEHLEKIERDDKIRRSHFIIDEDGVGGGAVDNFKGCTGFINNSKPIQSNLYENSDADKREQIRANYTNLKSQCWWKLASLTRDGEIGITCDDEAKQFIIEDLEQIRRKDADRDGKLAVEGKDRIKERIGRSTDIGDTLMMRMIFEIKPKSNVRLAPVRSPGITSGLRTMKF